MTRLEALRRPDPVGAVVTSVAGVIFVLHGFGGELTRDLGLYAYAGQQVADGVPPYVGLMNRSGPLAHLVPGLGAAAARVVGADDLLGMRVLCLLLSVALVWATYVLGRDLFERRLAGVAAAATLACLPVVISYATGGPREKTTMMLLLTWALVAMLRKRWWWTGALVALATLTWQPVFFPAAVAAVVCALVARGERLRGLAGIAGGGIIVTALMVAYFVAVGAVRDFADGFVLIHVSYTEQPGLRDDLERQWEGLLLGFGQTIWIVVVGVLAMLTLGVRNLLSRQRRSDPLGRTQIALSVATLVGLAWSWRVFNGWGDALLLVPFAAVGIAALVAAIAERLPLRTAAAVTFVWVTLAAVVALNSSLFGGTPTLAKQKREVAGVFALLPPDAKLLSVEAPQPLVLTGRTNLTQHQMFRAGLINYVDDSWPGGLDGYADTVSADAPDLIAVGRYSYFAWLKPILADDYTEVGTSPGWTWWVRNGTPPDILIRMQEAVSG